jgi:hypothetical protein
MRRFQPKLVPSVLFSIVSERAVWSAPFHCETFLCERVGLRVFRCQKNQDNRSADKRAHPEHSE